MQRKIRCINCGSEEHRHFVTVHGNRGASFIAREHRVVLCAHCGLGFLNPQHEEADYERYYRSFNLGPIRSTGKAMLRRGAYRQIQAAFLIDTIKKFWPDRRLSDLLSLDVGCGPGVLLALLRDHGLPAEGLEIGEHAIDFAGREFGVTVHSGTVFQHALGNRRYDVVTSTAAIEHFTDPARALTEMRRLLKPGGLLYVNTQDLLGMVLKSGIGAWFKFVHTYYYTEQTLGSLIESAGFKIVRSWTVPPLLKTSFLAPDNYCSGELNIIAERANIPERRRPRADSADRIVDAYNAARARDRRDAVIGRIMRQRYVGYPLRRINRFIKPPEVFADFFDTAGKVRSDMFAHVPLTSI